MSESRASDDPLGLVGTTLEGKYRIESVAGKGAFGTVYKATHLVWNRPVAVKAFRALAELPDAQRDALVAEFIREGALLAQLSERSAAIVQARDVGTLTAGREHVPYMILEWLDGTTLEDALHDDRQRGLPPRALEEVVRLLGPVAEALALAHEKGIAHRDVKPGNVFLLGDPRSPACTPKLLDFGVAKVVQDAQKMGGSFAKTAGGVTSFTPAYGAPEQFSRTHGATGPWTDVFALALVAGELLAGREALQGDSVVQLGFAACDPARRPTPRTLGAAVTDAVERVFAKALAVRPEDRWQNAGELWSALRGALGATPSRPAGAPGHVSRPVVDDQSNPLAQTAPAFIAPPAQSPPGRRPWPALALVGVVVVSGVGAFFAVRARAPTAAPIASAPAASLSAAPVTSAPPRPPCPENAVRIPGGKFQMGLDEPPPGKEYPPYLDSARPVHAVTVSAFCIDRLEVTVEQYKGCSDTGRCKRAATANYVADMTAAQHKVYDPVCNAADAAARAKHPINCVDWAQADEYCKEHGGRLPTEAEWELAALGQDGRLYPWGDEPPAKGHVNGCGTECIAWAKKHGVLDDFPAVMYDADDGWETTAPAGSFPAGKSRYGLEDVVGNVWEWTSDWYAPYTKTATVDPKGPDAGTERVIRGGAWNAAFADWARPQFRYHAPAAQRSHGIGFRCAYQPR